MKTLVCLTLAVSALASPALSFAQSAPSPVTRAQVRAELVRLEQAGYIPGTGDAYYPVDIQAAEAKIAAQDSQQLGCDLRFGGLDIDRVVCVAGARDIAGLR